jgi:dihydroorotase
MSQLLIKNGRIIDPASATDMPGDILVKDGIIAAIGAAVGADLEAPGAEIFDATGLVVAPGFIDMHVHLREPGIEHADTI